MSTTATARGTRLRSSIITESDKVAVSADSDHERALAKLPIIDAHQHFWDIGHGRYPWLEGETPIPFRYGDYSALKRSYLPPDYRQDSSSFDIVQTVHIEAEWERSRSVDETIWLEGLAAKYGLPSACVAHAALARPDADDVLARQANRNLVRGIRDKPAAAARHADARRGVPGSMDDERWRRGYAKLSQHGFSFDLQTPWWHLDAAADLARDFPDTTIIVNHTGLPADRSAEGLAGWRDYLERAAGTPNIALKISGLGQPGLPWTVESNGPVIRDAIAIFGADRCMFASNFPVDRLVATLETVTSGFLTAIERRSLDEQQMLTSGNAVRIYRLNNTTTE
jgi:predicted TIM-barrel fold metal-dependent hydrolase